MLKAIDVDDGYLLCPECEGSQRVEEMNGPDSTFVDCDFCHGMGQVEDDRPECEWCNAHTDEEKLVEMPGGKFFCPSCAENVSD